MNSNPAIEQFVADYFRERTASLKRRLEIHQMYWRRFYHVVCLRDSRRGVVKQSEAEKITNISPTDTGAEVVTTGHGLSRARYHVRTSAESWLIHEVDAECTHCPSTDTSVCIRCRGTGWLNSRRAADYMSQFRAAHQSAWAETPAPEEELRGGVHDPAIDQFMTDHFRARTESRKKEAEIHADFAHRFYSPEYNWKRELVSVDDSETERITKIVPVSTGAYVFTRNPDVFGLRYHLRPEENGWLIWDVDNECPVCYLQGRRDNCIWCRGTIWNHKKVNSPPACR